MPQGLYFSKALFEGLIYGREICFSKSIGLAHSWKEIYVSNLQQVFSETRLEDEDLSKNSAMQVLCLYRPRKSKPRLQWTTQIWRVIRVNIVMQFLLLCSSELYSVSCRIMFWHLKLCCDFLHYVFHFRLISSRPPNYDFRYWHSVVRYDLLNYWFDFLNYVLHFRL